MINTLFLLLACAVPQTDTFDNGTNPNGWNFVPWDVIESSGGNPGGWLHADGWDTYYPILKAGASAAAPWTGDFIASGVVRISLDAQTVRTDFPVNGGFAMSLLLRDDRGTAGVDDDDYAYFVGPEIPLPGDGWKHFDFAVPSRCGVSLPPGWRGGWSGDAVHFRPGVTWQDVLASVDRVEIWWSDPANFAIFQMWEVGADNLAIATAPPLTLQPPAPGSAGMVNQLSAWHAEPGDKVLFGASLTTGSVFANCNGRPLALGLSGARRLGAAVADAGGIATLSVMVPPSLSGATVQFQAVDGGRCEPSAVLAATFL